MPVKLATAPARTPVTVRVRSRSARDGAMNAAIAIVPAVAKGRRLGRPAAAGSEPRTHVA